MVSAIRSMISILEGCNLLRFKFKASSLVRCEFQWVFERIFFGSVKTVGQDSVQVLWNDNVLNFRRILKCIMERVNFCC